MRLPVNRLLAHAPLFLLPPAGSRPGLPPAGNGAARPGLGGVASCPFCIARDPYGACATFALFPSPRPSPFGAFYYSLSRVNSCADYSRRAA